MGFRVRPNLSNEEIQDIGTTSRQSVKQHANDISVFAVNSRNPLRASDEKHGRHPETHGSDFPDPVSFESRIPVRPKKNRVFRLPRPDQHFSPFGILPNRTKRSFRTGFTEKRVPKNPDFRGQFGNIVRIAERNAGTLHRLRLFSESFIAINLHFLHKFGTIPPYHITKKL